MANKQLWQFKWHFWYIYLLIIGLAFTILTPIIGNITKKAEIARFSLGVGQLLLAGAFVVVIFAILVMVQRIAQGSAENTEKLEDLLQTMNKQRTLLSQISHGVRLSEAAKAIVFGDQDRQGLREAVLEKLHQQDFDATYAMIDNIAHRSGYELLAAALKVEAEKYKNASDEERVNQVITHIEKLCEDHLWTKATMQVQRLLGAYPTHLKVQALPQFVADKREARKRELLAAWDDAVKRQATDESLEILRELDLYLTPNEGLALQEAARDIFRNKLHELGVQFRMAVTEKKWNDAFLIGDQIARDFPNSRMAQEIREKYEILKDKIGQPKA